MARYFFDLINGHGLERDDEGIELSSSDKVREHVARILTDIAREEMPDANKASIRVNVRDDTDFGVYFGELVFRNGWTERP